jgi:hypothetical protein
MVQFVDVDSAGHLYRLLIGRRLIEAIQFMYSRQSKSPLAVRSQAKVERSKTCQRAIPR